MGSGWRLEVEVESSEFGVGVDEWAVGGLVLRWKKKERRRDRNDIFFRAQRGPST